MLIGFNKKNFGQYLKELRLSKKLTQKQVFEITNVSTETLRRLENGYTIPQFRTMEELSIAYQADILKVFMTLRKANNYYRFYQLLDDIIIDNDGDKLTTIYDEFKNFLLGDDTEIFDAIELKQFKYILGSLEVMYSDSNDYDKSLDLLVKSIKINNPDFSLDSVEKFNYTYLDYKSLLLLSKLFGELKNNELSNHILLFLNDQCLFVSESYKYFEEINRMHIKITFNIAYNYHCLDNYNKVIEFTKLGIQKCLKMKTFYYLHGFYYRLGIAYFKLGKSKEQYMPWLEKSLLLLEIEERSNLIELYREKTLQLYKIKI